ncbi:MAG: hypothetical protein ACTTJS_03045 [Wolinella sp.]
MHGKILYYNEVTQIGTITTATKRVFEFSKHSWHDRKNLPVSDMFVEFRLSDGARASDCKESNFKRLQKLYPINESDFWQSDSDEKLEILGIERREQMILSGLNSLDITKPLEVNPSISRCFDLYFSDELEFLEQYKELFGEGSDYPTLNYALLKPFLQKAKTHLLSIDTSISAEVFAEIEQDIHRSRARIERMEHISHLDIDSVFEQMFLSLQIPYAQACRRLELEGERLLQVENRLKKIPYDLETFKRRADIVKGEQKVAYEEKIVATMTEAKNLQKERLYRARNCELLRAQIEQFKRVNLEELLKAYHFIEQISKILQYLKHVLDYLGYALDYTIWQEASRSSNIAMSFYNQAVQGGFSAFTFLRSYLKILDKSQLSPHDRELYKYLSAHEKKSMIKLLVLSEDSAFMARLKRQLLGANKDVLIHAFARGIDSLAWIRSNSVDAVFVDINMHSMSAREWLEILTSNKKNVRAKIFCFGSSDSSLDEFGVLALPKNLSEEKLVEIFERFIMQKKEES